VIVVADTSPLNYLVQLGEADILAELFGYVVVPEAVRDELRSPHAPMAVRSWMESLPDWVRIQ
jgi:predicted nucleic acid-binding protein